MRSVRRWQIINVTLNLIAMAIAWYLMAVVASVYSGLRGGRMFADGLFGLLADFKVVEYFPESWQPALRPWLTTETSIIDEGVMYLLAGAGIYSQVFSNFEIFFPLNARAGASSNPLTHLLPTLHLPRVSSSRRSVFPSSWRAVFLLLTGRCTHMLLTWCSSFSFHSRSSSGS